MNFGSRGGSSGFTLVEVVLSLGIVGFAIVAIFGVLPVGLNASHASQDESRAAQIGQDIVTSLSSQSQASFPNCVIKQSATPTAQDFSYGVNLGTPGSYIFAADNDGHLVVPNGTVPNPYQVTLFIAAPPTGFDSTSAATVTVRVAWQPYAQNFRDFVRIITKY